MNTTAMQRAETLRARLCRTLAALYPQGRIVRADDAQGCMAGIALPLYGQSVAALCRIDYLDAYGLGADADSFARSLLRNMVVSLADAAARHLDPVEETQA